VVGDAVEGHAVQHVIPAGTWQAVETAPGSACSFFGVTMAPWRGFERTRVSPGLACRCDPGATSGREAG
jgi:predicted cupin superfamily sugar epimerase